MSTLELIFTIFATLAILNSIRTLLSKTSIRIEFQARDSEGKVLADKVTGKDAKRLAARIIEVSEEDVESKKGRDRPKKYRRAKDS